MTSETSSSPTQGRPQQIGRFRPIAELARGGMGVVFLASAEEGGREELFAIKTLLPEFAGEEQYRRMFLAEATLGVRLEHPNIVRTVEVGGSKSQYFMALEYLDGQPLRAVRKAIPDLAPGDTLRIVSDVLRALSYAHTLCDLDGTPLRIVHRDISPENVFLTHDGRVILLDFGVAKTDDSAGRTEVGKLKGRVRYMAPEQVLGAEVDARADIFAVGVLLSELLTGQRFWGGAEEMVIIRQLVNGDIPTLREGHCSPRLAAVCAKALNPRVEGRFASAEEFRRELDLAALELGPRSTLGALSARMSSVFEPSRARVQALLEQAKGLDSHSDEPLPSLSFLLTESTKTSRSGARSRSAGSTPAMAGDPSEHEARPPRRGLVLGGLALAGLILGGVLLFPRSQAPAAALVAPASASQAPAAGVARESAPPEAPATVELLIEVTPPTAQVTLDGVVLAGGSPYKKRLERDDKTHQIEFAGAGYEPRTESVMLSGNLTLRVGLDKAGTRPAATSFKSKTPGAVASATSPAGATATAGPPIKGGVVPNRPINSSNPYAN